MSALTEDELELVDMLGKCSNMFGRIVGKGRTRDADLSEIVHHIHVLQQAVLSQAGARAYPDKFRLLGESFHSEPPTFKRGDKVRVIRPANGSWLKTQLSRGAEFIVTRGNYAGEDGEGRPAQLVNIKCPGGVGWNVDRFERCS